MSVDAWLALLIASAAAGELAGETADEVKEEPVMDMEFLEYLGSWDGADDEWLMFESAVPRDEDDDENDDEPNEPAPEADDVDPD